MSSLEKHQVISFLKILQIPTDLSAAEIKQSLLKAGWNEDDAEEAINVLNPKYSKLSSESLDNDTNESKQSQIVAQRYIREDNSTVPKTTAPSNEKDELSTSDNSRKLPEIEVVEIASRIKQEQLYKESDNNTVDRPHTDAPWLKHQVDIYDVTPEEREGMIRTVYKTSERLDPQTIHALFGIDVDLSEFEHRYHKQHLSDGFSWLQIMIIIILSVILAVTGFFAGMYYFEVGLFHPSMRS